MTNIAFKNATADKVTKLYDERGLYLLLSPGRGRDAKVLQHWRFKYRFGGRERLLALGVFPDVDLKTARERRNEARRQVANGIDLGEKRKAEKAARAEADANSFEAIAREWHDQRIKSLEKSTFDGIIQRFERRLFPWLRDKPISTISAPQTLAVLRRAEASELGETPKRCRQYCGQIFRQQHPHPYRGLRGQSVSAVCVEGPGAEDTAEHRGRGAIDISLMESRFLNAYPTLATALRGNDNESPNPDAITSHFRPRNVSFGGKSVQESAFMLQ